MCLTVTRTARALLPRFAVFASSIPMGSSHSFVTDPNAFATEVKESDDASHWKTYDYVIVGGGRAIRLSGRAEPLTLTTFSRHGWFGACVTSIRRPKRDRPVNRSW
jgi:hypothetical protein